MRMPRSGIAALAAAAVLFPTAWATTAQAAPLNIRAGQASDDSRSTLRHDLDAITRKDGVVGAEALMVTGAGRYSARSGVADRTTGTPVPEQGYMRIGSNTKTFVATVILQLVGEGRSRTGKSLSLDDTVDKHLPGVVTGNGNDGKKITVRQLLQHTSGLFNYTSDEAMSVLTTEEDYRKHKRDTYTPEQLVGFAMKHAPYFQPGEPGKFAYSNTNYVLAGMIIEEVTGHDWREEVRNRITKPLGMSHTFSARNDATLPDPHAHAYYRFTDDGPLVDTTELNMSWGGSAGDMVSTTGDLARFWQALLGGKLLKPAQKAEMLTTVPTHDFLPGAEYGLGIIKRPLGDGQGSYWGHGGSTPGHLNDNGFTEDGKRGIVLLRSTNDSALGDGRDARADRLVADALRRTR
ncbi:serine hydrolase [Streptomyces morookaense]|nr:serine hydrolase [Streptomyces morookaense]